MMNEMPTITINEKKIQMPKPKIKLWRKMIKFAEKQKLGNLDKEEIFDDMIELVVVAFNNPSVTRDSVEENVDLDELMAIFEHILGQINSIAITKGMQIPNGMAPSEI